MTPGTAPAPDAAADVPAWLTTGPVEIALWVGTLVVLAALVRRILRRNPESAAEIAGQLARNTLPIGAMVGATALLLVGLQQFHALAGPLGTIAQVATIGIQWGLAYVAGLFVARQFLAPPWWRLSAWDPQRAQRSFGVRDALQWIRDDIADLFATMRLIDRIVVLVAVPMASVQAMLWLGSERALMLGYGALLVCYVALVFALFTASRVPGALLTRLQDLRRVARRIAGGDYSARVGYSSDTQYEELGELVADVNLMARVLESREQENRALNQQLQQTLQVEQERASRDQLTQLRNHRYFQEALAAELYRCSRTGELTTIAIIDLDDFKAVNDSFGHQEGDAVLVRTAQALVQTLRPYDLAARLGGEEFGVIFPSTTPQEAKVVMDRIMDVLVTAGPGSTPQTFSGGIATFPLHATDQSTLYQYADSSAYAAKMNGKAHVVVFEPGRVSNIAEDDRVNTRERSAQLDAARTLVQTVDMLEGGGNEHSESVAHVCAMVAAEMGYDDQFCQQVFLCGLLHDVGKLGLEQSLVQKRGQLTAAEYEQVKRHPELSAQIVMSAGLGEIAGWVRHHHEHFDGSGYPHGLAAQDIPVPSRIVLVAEAWDVMTTDRPYRGAMSSKDAADELLRGAGTRFDPEVVAHLLRMVRRGDVVAGTIPDRRRTRRAA